MFTSSILSIWYNKLVNVFLFRHCHNHTTKHTHTHTHNQLGPCFISGVITCSTIIILHLWQRGHHLLKRKNLNKKNRHSDHYSPQHHDMHHMLATYTSPVLWRIRRLAPECVRSLEQRRWTLSTHLALGIYQYSQMNTQKYELIDWISWNFLIAILRCDSFTTLPPHVRYTRVTSLR